jgi:uncharacterized RDD family membrane protein YckC
MLVVAQQVHARFNGVYDDLLELRILSVENSLKCLIDSKQVLILKVVFKIHCTKCGEELPEGSKFCIKCGAPVTFEATAETVADRFTKDEDLQQHWIKRVIAYIIDSVIVGVAAAVLLIIALFPLFIVNPTGVLNLLSFPFAMGLINIIYCTFADSMRGATIGKSVLGLKVVAQSGGNPNFENALIRNISKIHPVLLLLDVVAGVTTSNDLHQKYSDKMTGTTVN